MAIATEREAALEYARNAGMDRVDNAWILTPQDSWERNPFYCGPSVPHPEDDYQNSMEAERPTKFRCFLPSEYDDDEIPF